MRSSHPAVVRLHRLSSTSFPLSATLLFSPREMKSYLRWQRQTLHIANSALGRLPTATEYSEYFAWRTRKERDDEFMLDPCGRLRSELSAHLGTSNASNEDFDGSSMSNNCGHVTHPATPLEARTEQCPPCLMQCHLQYMQLLDERLESVGGPFNHSHAPNSFHEEVLSAWYSGKLELVRVMWKMEGWALEEEMWKDRFCGKELANSHTATKALEMCWRDEEGRCSMNKAQMVGGARTTKRVSFGEGTSFEQGRPECYYRIRSPRYEPSRHGDEEEEEEGEGEFDPEGEEQNCYTSGSGSEESDDDMGTDTGDEDEVVHKTDEYPEGDFIIFGE